METTTYYQKTKAGWIRKTRMVKKEEFGNNNRLKSHNKKVKPSH